MQKKKKNKKKISNAKTRKHTRKIKTVENMTQSCVIVVNSLSQERQKHQNSPVLLAACHAVKRKKKRTGTANMMMMMMMLETDKEKKRRRQLGFVCERDEKKVDEDVG